MEDTTTPSTADILPLDSPQGARLFAEVADKMSPLRLLAYFETQATLSFCGVASAVMVLNALGLPRPVSPEHGQYRLFTQANLFNAKVEAARPRAVIEQRGMPLGALAQIIKCFATRVTTVHASTSAVDEWRKALRQKVYADTFIICNYHRPTVGQEGGGHMSPLGAYHQGTDRVLILDVARYRYLPVWVKVETLWRAMLTMDSESQMTRGYLVVSRNN